MDDNRTWQVIITNQLSNDQDKNQIVQQLALLFKTSETRAEQLISKSKTIVKDKIDEATAKKYFAAISKTGAHCEMNNTAEEDLPDIIEPVQPEADKQAATEGLIRQPTTEATSLEPELAMVARAEKDEKETRETLAKYQNVDSSFFCPDCGTIRSSADATCLHCGYDPLAVKSEKTGIMRIVYIAAVVLAIIVAAAYFAMPFYEQFAKKSDIEEGLQLAFDTRNHITKFILKTNFWPNQNIDADLPGNISNEIVSSITITGNGAFTVTLHEQVLGKANQTIIFTPNSLRGKLAWNCSKGTLDNEFRPEVCKIKQ